MRKQRVVLHVNLRNPADVHAVQFYPDDVEMGSTQHTMDYDAWVDMGRPNQITVTVRPGDRLNV